MTKTPAKVPRTDESNTVTVTFKDLAYKSRTVVLDDGRTFEVRQSRIAATDPGLLAHLEQCPEFEQLPDA